MADQHPGAVDRGRRHLLELAASGILLSCLPRWAWGLGAASKLDIAELKLTSGTSLRPRAWVRLLYEVVQTTSVEAAPSTVALSPDDPALFNHPFAVLVGNDALPPLSDRALEQLARYLQYGGFLLVDDASGVMDSAFDRSVRELCARLFPSHTLAPLSFEHSVYRSFFLIQHPVGRVAVVDWLEGVTLGETAPIIYCRNDLSGALDRNPDGTDRHPCVPGGYRQRREAVKLGINLILYALTSNYKKDIAHVRRLMLDGRLE